MDTRCYTWQSHETPLPWIQGVTPGSPIKHLCHRDKVLCLAVSLNTVTMDTRCCSRQSHQIPLPWIQGVMSGSLIKHRCHVTHGSPIKHLCHGYRVFPWQSQQTPSGRVGEVSMLLLFFKGRGCSTTGLLPQGVQGIELEVRRPIICICEARERTYIEAMYSASQVASPHKPSILHCCACAWRSCVKADVTAWIGGVRAWNNHPCVFGGFTGC